MAIRFFWLALMCTLGTMPAWAGELPTALFAETPAPGAGELVSPRMIAVDGAKSRCYVLDSGQKRIVALTLDGQQTAVWTLGALGVDDTFTTDPLLPNPALGVGGGSAYLLCFDRDTRQADLIHLEGTGKNRTVRLPDDAEDGAVTLDGAGRLLLAYLHTDDGKPKLILARENDNGKMGTLATLANPCEPQKTNLSITGFTTAPDGRFAVGLAQSGAATYAFVRSWLVQGTLNNGAVVQAMEITHRFSLLNGLGKVDEQFHAAVAKAGQDGYPAKACVPLFTSLAYGPQSMVISGGHTVDPFLRVYSADGALRLSAPRQAAGGQHIAAFTLNKRACILATAEGSIEILATDGRTLGQFGAPVPYNLADTVSLAANQDAVYAAIRNGATYQLLRFATDGTFCWQRPLPPPKGMAQAQPFLTASDDRVFVGWRLPAAAGVGWVETVMDDGSVGLPLWNDPYTAKATLPDPPCSTPVITGKNDRVYVLREMKEGVRLQAYAPTGIYVQQFPPAVQGITAALESGVIAWARPDEDGMAIITYSPQGAERGRKRITRPAHGASLFPAQTNGLWGWLTTTNTLLKLDANLIVVDDATLTINGEAITDVSAVTGDGGEKVYIALSGRILVVTPE